MPLLNCSVNQSFIDALNIGWQHFDDVHQIKNVIF